MRESKQTMHGINNTSSCEKEEMRVDEQDSPASPEFTSRSRGKRGVSRADSGHTREMGNQISRSKILPTEITDDLIVKLGLDHNNSSQSQGSFQSRDSNSQFTTKRDISHA